MFTVEYILNFLVYLLEYFTMDQISSFQISILVGTSVYSDVRCITLPL